VLSCGWRSPWRLTVHGRGAARLLGQPSDARSGKTIFTKAEEPGVSEAGWH